MGHTLTVGFSGADQDRIASLLTAAERAALRKIPFGRDCDRDAADAALPYHMTVAHWGKELDRLYLPRLEGLRPPRLTLRAVSAACRAVRGGALLYLAAEPERGLDELRALLGGAGLETESFLHITLAVDADGAALERIRRRINASGALPATLEVPRLDLYHVWRPVRLVRSFPCGGGE